AGTRPYTRITPPRTAISTYPSLTEAALTRDSTLTGSKGVCGTVSARARCTFAPKTPTHLCNRLAFRPCASAIAANDTPGSRARRTSSRLADLSYRHRPSRRCPRIRLGTRSILESSIGVHLLKVGGHHPYRSIRLRPDGLGMTLTHERTILSNINDEILAAKPADA